jgi:hypothetical protein
MPPLGQLEQDVAAVPHDPGADLHEPRSIVTDQCATSFDSVSELPLASVTVTGGH